MKQAVICDPLRDGLFPIGRPAVEADRKIFQFALAGQ